MVWGFWASADMSAGVLSMMQRHRAFDLNHDELLWKQLEHVVHKKCRSSQSNLLDVLREA